MQESPPRQQTKSKISWIAAILFSGYLLMLDTVDVLLLLFGLDDFLITDMLAFPITQLYLRWMGVRGTYNLLGNMLEFVPYLGSLPLRTMSFIFTVWMTWKEERKAALTQAQSALQRTRGSTAPLPSRTPALAPARARAGMDIRVAK
ncbi:MAG: hypothetical protein G01um1014106_162 [Parcubacteria group bacterium Gr01-1014_106]|nr:MAG: hypothetical protein G01um1014106_162 [Parcubacteria group bacterium Gr01-1014_106]